MFLCDVAQTAKSGPDSFNVWNETNIDFVTQKIIISRTTYLCLISLKQLNENAHCTFADTIGARRKQKWKQFTVWQTLFSFDYVAFDPPMATVSLSTTLTAADTSWCIWERNRRAFTKSTKRYFTILLDADKRRMHMKITSYKLQEICSSTLLTVIQF